MSEGLKLNLGAGSTVIPGYTPVDVKNGQQVYPLRWGDGDADEIRASHILEHFSHRQTAMVLREWCRVLKPGGIIRIAVPNFDRLIEMYEKGLTVAENGTEAPLEAYILGGHIDGHDVHLAIFNEQKLRDLMDAVGLVDIQPWRDGVVDCSAYEFSLNLQGRKLREGESAPKPVETPASESPATSEPVTAAPAVVTPQQHQRKVGAVMSIPRLGFQDNFTCAIQGLFPLRIPFKTYTGAFWGQCLQRAFNMMVDDGFETILTLDYDSVFSPDMLRRLIDTLDRHPEVDALAPVMCHRSNPSLLMTVKGEDGKLQCRVPYDDFFRSDVKRINTGHFGLTLIRVAALKRTPKPWFWGKPNEHGEWDDGRVDDDIWFWQQWEKAGNSLYLANRVVVGHAELNVRWPGRDFRPVFQAPNDFFKEGMPMETWQ